MYIPADSAIQPASQADEENGTENSFRWVEQLPWIDSQRFTVMYADVVRTTKQQLVKFWWSRSALWSLRRPQCSAGWSFRRPQCSAGWSFRRPQCSAGWSPDVRNTVPCGPFDVRNTVPDGSPDVRNVHGDIGKLERNFLAFGELIQLLGSCERNKGLGNEYSNVPQQFPKK